MHAEVPVLRVLHEQWDQGPSQRRRHRSTGRPGAAHRKRRRSVGSAVLGLRGDDEYCIADLPDTVSAGAVSLAIAAFAANRIKTVVLETAEEVDEACKRSTELDYRPPGAN